MFVTGTTDQKGDTMVVATKEVADLTAAQKKAFYASVNAAAEAAGQAAGEAAVVDQYVAVQRATDQVDRHFFNGLPSK